MVELHEGLVNVRIQRFLMRHQQQGIRFPFRRIGRMDVVELGVGYKTMALIKPQSAP